MTQATFCSHDIASPRHNFGSTLPVDVLGGIGSLRLKAPELEKLVQKTAASQGIRRIAELGCGDGALSSLYKNKSLDIVGFDLPSFRKEFKQNAKNSKFISCFFDSVRSIHETTRFLDDKKPTLFVAAGLLNRLDDPRSILRRLRQLLKAQTKNRLILASHVAGDDNKSPASALREWRKGEFENLVRTAGFVIEQTNLLGDILALTVSCSEQSYRKFLEKNNLPSPSVYLMTTTETVLHKNYGGIAAYLRDMWDILPEKPLIYSTFPLPTQIPQEGFGQRVLDRARLLRTPGGTTDLHIDEPSMDVLEDLRHLIFLYDSIKLIEIQDYLGDGCRLPQAKRAGLIPPDIAVICRGHGNQIYLERATRRWSNLFHEPMMLRERMAVETADYFLSASDYLRRLYLENGISLPKHSKTLSLPYLPTRAEPKKGDLDTLIFFGKPIPAKGFPDFVGAIEQLSTSRLFQKRIKKIIILGGAVPETAKNVFEKLPSGIEVEGEFLPHEKARGLLRSLGSGALVVMPYLEDNRPVSVVEAIDAGCHPVAYATGGVPEIIPAAYHPITLCPPGAGSLAAHIEVILEMDEKKREASLKNLNADWRREQTKINETIVSSYASFRKKAKAASAAFTSPVKKISVLVPVWNTPLDLIAESIEGLNAQSYPPEEVIFFDQGATSSYIGSLRAYAKAHLVHSFRIIVGDKGSNLKECKTPLAAFVSPGNIPLPHFLSDMVSCFSFNPDMTIVLGMQRQFLGGDHWRSARSGMVFSPIGSAGLITQIQNTLGHSDAAFNVSKLKAITGKLGDEITANHWAFYLRVVYSDGHIAIIPRVNSLNRVREQAMQHEVKFAEESYIIPTVTTLDPWGYRRLRPTLRSIQQQEDQNVTAILESLSYTKVEGLFETIRSARDQRLPPGTDLWKADGAAATWHNRPAHKIQFPMEKPEQQEQALEFCIRLSEMPMTWVELFQHGDSLSLYRLKVHLGPEGMLRLTAGAPLYEEAGPSRDIKIPIESHVVKHIVVSLSATVGCMLLWIDGKRVMTHMARPWRLPASSTFWLGSRRFSGRIEKLCFYNKLLVEGDIAEIRP